MEKKENYNTMYHIKKLMIKKKKNTGVE